MYEITKTLADTKSDKSVELIQMVKLSQKHAMVDFAAGDYVAADTFRFESGWIQVDEDTRIELTRLLSSCDSEHDHGVYYQAPRHMTLWETMFAIGEIPADGIDPFENDTDKDISGDKA